MDDVFMIQKEENLQKCLELIYNICNISYQSNIHGLTAKCKNGTFQQQKIMLLHI